MLSPEEVLRSLKERVTGDVVSENEKEDNQRDSVSTFFCDMGS